MSGWMQVRFVLLASVLVPVVSRAGDAPPDPRWAAVTPTGVRVSYSDGRMQELRGTEGARGVAFAKDAESLYIAGPHDLRRVTLDGTVLEVVTAGWEMIDSPAVSPDGQTVAFSGYTRSAKWAVYTLTGRNANPVMVAKGLHPVFESDGRTLLFENYADESAQIYRHDPDTREVARVSYDREGKIERAVGPALTRAGDRFAFSSLGSIKLKHMRSGEVSSLTDGSFYDCHPRFTADESELLFIRYRRDERLGRVDPRLMRADLETGEVSEVPGWPATRVAPAPLAAYADAEGSRRP